MSVAFIDILMYIFADIFKEYARPQTFHTDFS
jgi:hypothetical protein